MTDILDLKGWTVRSKTQSGNECVIDAEYTTQPANCPKCGVVDTPYKHGVKPIKYRDSPIRGSTVVILANVQRYRCKHCKETFLQPLEGIYPDMRMTQRCVEYIETQCLRDTFVRIAEHIGCDDKTVRTIAGTYIDAMNAKFKPWLPEWLGIDETQIDGELRCIITDVVNRIPIDMLPTRDKGGIFLP
jgi:transposase